MSRTSCDDEVVLILDCFAVDAFEWCCGCACDEQRECALQRDLVFHRRDCSDSLKCPARWTGRDLRSWGPAKVTKEVRTKQLICRLTSLDVPLRGSQGWEKGASTEDILLAIITTTTIDHPQSLNR